MHCYGIVSVDADVGHVGFLHHALRVLGNDVDAVLLQCGLHQLTAGPTRQLGAHRDASGTAQRDCVDVCEHDAYSVKSKDATTTSRLAHAEASVVMPGGAVAERHGSGD